jgi:hypothetical protein
MELDYVAANARSRKLFLVDGLKKLYWYEVFTAMISPGRRNKIFVCPCRIKGTDLVLVWILKTRCNKPRYDCLVYNIKTDLATVINANNVNWEKDYDCDVTLEDYDFAMMSK